MRPSCTRRTAASTWSISNVSRNTLWHMQRPVQTVSAYATEAGLVLAQRAVDGKSNEITAIPELLDMLNLKGAIVSIDAMGTQKEIARRIVDKGADYVLALKGNQTSLHEDAALFFADPRARQLFKQFLCENRNPCTLGLVVRKDGAASGAPGGRARQESHIGSVRVKDLAGDRHCTSDELERAASAPIIRVGMCDLSARSGPRKKKRQWPMAWGFA